MRGNRMNIEQLRYVVEVATVGSISGAAQTLYVTQSAISQSITNLEKELGVKVFIRSRNGAIPTDIGKVIIQKAFETLDKLDEIRLEAHADNQLIEGRLRLGTIPSPLMHLTKTLALFKKDYPNITMNVSEISSQSIIDDIANDKLDIGLVGLSMEGKEFYHQDIEIKVILRGKMVVAVSKHSKLAFAESITLEEIRKHLLVIYEDERMWEFIREIAAINRDENILFSTNNTDAIRNAVKENLAITIAPDYTINNDPYVLANEIVPLEIADVEQEYPGMAIVWSKSRSNRLINNFASRLEADIMKLKHM